MPEAHLYDYQGIMGQLVGYSQGGPIMVVWYFQISLGLIYCLIQIRLSTCSWKNEKLENFQCNINKVITHFPTSARTFLLHSFQFHFELSNFSFPQLHVPLSTESNWYGILKPV